MLLSFITPHLINQYPESYCLSHNANQQMVTLPTAQEMVTLSGMVHETRQKVINMLSRDHLAIGTEIYGTPHIANNRRIAILAVYVATLAACLLATRHAHINSHVYHYI